MEGNKWWNTCVKFSDHPFDPDIKEYFSRIGYEGSMEPKFSTLCSIQYWHVRSIPFENIDVYLGKPINTDPVFVYEKIVHQKRGGYCHEQNNLLYYILRKLGFDVTPILARVRWMLRDNHPVGNNHLCLQVKLDDKNWLVDVGFGGQSPTSPLEIGIPNDQILSHDIRRVISSPEGYRHQIKVSENNYMDAYVFALGNNNEATPIDCEISNWTTCTHPDSIFTKNLIIGMVGDNCRYSLVNISFTTRYELGMLSEETKLSASQVVKVVKEKFGLDLPKECIDSLPIESESICSKKTVMETVDENCSVSVWNEAYQVNDTFRSSCCTS